MKGPQRDRKHRRRSVLDGLGRAATRAGEGTGLPEPFTRTASPPPWSPVGAEGRTSPYFPLAEVPHWAPLQRESRLAANNYIWVRQTLTSLRACHTAKVLAELRARPSPTHTGTPRKRPPLTRFVPVYGLGKAEATYRFESLRGVRILGGPTHSLHVKLKKPSREAPLFGCAVAAARRTL